MHARHIQLAKQLAFAGTLPFIGTVVVMLYGLDSTLIRQSSLAYGALIIAFISGIHWGLFLTQAPKIPINLLVSSNLLTLLSWSSLMMDFGLWSYLTQILSFSILLMIDRQLLKVVIIERWFFILRCQATLIVITSLCLSLLLTHLHAKALF